MRFQKGEIVLCVKSGNPSDWDFGAEAYFGTECEILELCTSSCFWGVRHRVEFHDGRTAQLTEDFLRKRRPPQDNLFTEWFKSHIITDPICVPSLEETMKRTQANLQQFADLKPVERIGTTSREEGNG